MKLNTADCMGSVLFSFQFALLIIGTSERLSGEKLHTMLFSSSRETRKAAINQIFTDRNLENNTQSLYSQPTMVNFRDGGGGS
jgi:hypothetical protein